MARIGLAGPRKLVENHYGQMSSDRASRRILKHVIGMILVVVIAAGAGYAVFRHQTPVSLRDAVDRFRSGNDARTSDRYEVHPSADRSRGDVRTRRSRFGSVEGERNGNRGGSNRSEAVADIVAAAGARLVEHFDVMPAEGVYTYVGRGRESVDPVPPREFPRVTQRIITHEDHDTWVEHHIFSEERASWTRHTVSETFRLVHGQRNYIKMGPYDEDKTFPFNPPIQTAVFPTHVGASWSDRSTGRTNDGEDYTATWTVKAVENSKWDIDGVRTRVLGFEFFVKLEGEFNGTVSVKYWYAPRYGLTVREEYYADAQVGPLKYWGEWFVRLRSLTPTT